TADTVATIEAAGGQAVGTHLDVAEMDSCQAMADLALEKFGRIDVVVNNAALFGDISGGRFDQIPEDQWDAVMQVNIKGVWQCCKACVPALRQAGAVPSSISRPWRRNTAWRSAWITPCRKRR
ncbi:MAG: SDR family oxidoreductase, partial [Rhodospirillaceae bacterium]|nr:SDR family oxidoreductase [Rhodospirillaceae bacterium]